MTGKNDLETINFGTRKVTVDEAVESLVRNNCTEIGGAIGEN